MARLVVLCCTTGLAGLSQSAALTIYRIGGESVPAPDPSALGAPADSVQFVQLSWDELDEPPFGSSHLIDVRPDSIRPQFVPGDLNFTPHVRDGAGIINGWAGYGRGFTRESEMAMMWDEDPKTYYSGQAPFIGDRGTPYCGNTPDTFCKYIWVNLSGAFPLHAVRVLPPPGTEEDRHIPTYTLGINDGDPLKIGTRERKIRYEGVISVDFDVVSEVLENTTGVLEFEFSGEPVENIVFIAQVGRWQIAEFEIYFHGFAVNSNYTSGVIDLEQFGTLGPLTWAGELDPGSGVHLKVRSGDTADPHIYFRNTFRGGERSRYNAEGDALDRATYLRMETGEQGGIAPDLLNWSQWQDLDFSHGTAEFSSGPRRYVQVEADFHSGGRLDYFQILVSQPPVATRTVAEIEPSRVVARETSRFRYLLLPEITLGDLGFDRIEIATPTRVDSVESVSIDGVLLEDSQWLAEIDSSAFVVHIPRRDHLDTKDLIEIVFHTRIFDYGTVFEGRVFDSTRPWEMPQFLEPGDAAFLAENNSLTVEFVEVGRQALDEIELSTAVFTPNGDGVNDRLDISFDLVNLSAAVPVRLEVFDLAGTRRAELLLARLGSGPHSVSWDGMDDRGKLLAPGLYVLRLDVDTDDATFTATRVASVAY